MLGLETGGETTAIGDTDEDEDKRRRDAEKSGSDLKKSGSDLKKSGS